MGNERLTEDIVREHFRKHETPGQVVEEQISQDLIVAQALQRASKQGKGVGKPEFIITHGGLWADGVVLIECKADTSCHESAHHAAGQPSTPADIATCAVDGVLHYAKHVARQRNVIAIAVSGEKKSGLRVSTYRHMKGAEHAELLRDRSGKSVERLRAVSEYVDFFLFDPDVLKKNIDQLIAHTRAIHDLLRDYGKVTESEKPLVVSAALLALRHAPFRASWSVTTDADLAVEMYEAVDKVVKKAIGGSKRELMMSAYDFVRTHPELSKPVKIKVKGSPGVTTSPLRQLLGELEREVLPFAMTYPQIDVVGQFYAEFLRYSGGEGQGLGIVLTPRHLTELFVQVAQINRHDTVLDACAGTGGFLISAMIEMDRQVGDDEEAKRAIREQQLIGIEQRSDMFAMCVSNMLLRGDGKSNIHRGDCFDAVLQRRIVQSRPDTGIKQPNKGLLNPPYSQLGWHELDFVKAMMDMLAPGGTGVVVVPIKCALNNHSSREALLADHTLVAVMSLPDELFYPVATNTIPCALVLRAHAPHEQTDAPTWFGYWRDDGLVKVKHRGRVDVNGQWETIKARWIAEYKARSEIAGRCVKRRVTAKEEWCAEAYLETDPASITPGDFMRSVRDYALHRLSTAQTAAPSIAGMDTTKWKPFKYGDIFEIRKGYYNKKPPTTSDGSGVPFIGATDSANGVTSYITMDALKAYSRNGQIVSGESLDRKLFPGKCITVTNNGSVGEAFYQSQQFTCSHDVNPLYLKDKQVELSPALGLFLATIIRAEKYRWGYGRKWRPIRMPDSIIRLPATAAGKPDWKTMENWLNQLPLAKQIK